MKKQTLKPAIKAAKKAAKEKIESSLVAELKKVIAELGHSSKSLEKKIKKSSKKVAKLIAKELNIAKDTIIKPVESAVKKATAVPAVPRVTKPVAPKVAPAKTVAKPATADNKPSQA